jgi:uncharacterized protein
METRTLTTEDRKTLLTIARVTLAERCGAPGQWDSADEAMGETQDVRTIPISAALYEKRGAFVTLNKGRKLRGCIGTFRAVEPLHKVVRDMAAAAATSDPRFPPVEPDEVGVIEIEISALTALTRAEDVSQIEVGTHGIYVTLGSDSGVLLPQVAVEWGWDRDEFLAQTCSKAGLPRDAWQSPEAVIEVFSAEVFSESDLDGGMVTCA